MANHSGTHYAAAITPAAMLCAILSLRTRATIVRYNNLICSSTSTARPPSADAVNDSFGHNASFSAANVVHNYPATRSDRRPSGLSPFRAIA